MEGMGPETHVHKITDVPVFYMALALNDFDAGKSKWHSLRSLLMQGPRKSRCQGSPPLMTLVVDIACIKFKIITSPAIQTTGTLIVIKLPSPWEFPSVTSQAGLNGGTRRQSMHCMSIVLTQEAAIIAYSSHIQYCIATSPGKLSNKQYCTLHYIAE
jgi:hypothetical protein